MKNSPTLFNTEKCFFIHVFVFNFMLTMSLTSLAGEIERLENQYKTELQTHLSKVLSPLKSQEPQLPYPPQKGFDPQPLVNYEISEINIQVGAFTEWDLKIIGLTIQPYVEFQFGTLKQ